ncbi:MAG: hypothetical protein HC767_13625 [Akkermansiaceae bacterium]|nr:hypothetical protein [Akkermansiaceae bacterium]
MMVLRLFHARRPRPPYPFAQKEGATLAVENLTSEVNDPGALVQCWQLPSPRDLAGWISALCKWCGHSSVCKKYNEPRGSMADFLKNHEIQRRAEVLERLPEGRLVSTYASELLATNPLNIWIRIVLFILIGFALYWQLKEDVPIPPSVRGTFFRSVFEWSDGLAKFMLALVANAALDRQISMAIGLDKFCEFLRRHTGGDHNTAPYAWIDRPDIAKDEWE